MLWILTVCLLECFSGNKVLELFLQIFSPSTYKIEIRSAIMQHILRRNKKWGIVLPFRMIWNLYKEILCLQMSQPHLVLNLYAMSLLHKKRDLPPKQHLSANLHLSLAVIVSALQKSSHKDHVALVAPQ